MATVDHTGAAEERAWEVFLGAVDPAVDSAPMVPPGAAIVAADAHNVEQLKRRYKAEGRPVALVGENGALTVIKARGHFDLRWLFAAGILAAAWSALRSRVRIPA